MRAASMRTVCAGAGEWEGANANGKARMRMGRRECVWEGANANGKARVRMGRRECEWDGGSENANGKARMRLKVECDVRIWWTGFGARVARSGAKQRDLGCDR